jgi:hypothetical protein
MHRTISLLLLLSLATCHSGDEKKNTTIPVKQILPRATLRYEPPRDGKAEVARYQFTRGHYGIEPEGIAMLLIVREGVNKNTYVKTEKGGLPAIKIMSLKTLPIMNWNDRENSGMYSGDDLTPLRLSITAEEWCGNNYLEWVSRGDKAHLIGRSYIEDMVPKDEDVSLQKGYYLYEQMPLLVRAMVTGEPTAKIRLIVPQSAYLQPSEEELSVTLSRKEEAKITVPAGTFETVLIEVSADKPNPKFPAPERYWLEKKEHFIVKAERNEVHSEFGKFKASMPSLISTEYLTGRRRSLRYRGTRRLCFVRPTTISLRSTSLRSLEISLRAASMLIPSYRAQRARTSRPSISATLRDKTA